MVIETELLSHHAEGLAGETSCQKVKVKIVITTHVGIESNDVAHLYLISTIIIGLISFNRIGVDFRISDTIKRDSKIFLDSFHSLSETADTSEEFHMSHRNDAIAVPIAYASLTGTALPIWAYHIF